MVEADRAALRYRLQGTHSGHYLGVAPTGLGFDVEGLTLLRLADGRVVEEWHSPTELAILRQLGAVQANVPHAGRERGGASAPLGGGRGGRSAAGRARGRPR